MVSGSLKKIGFILPINTYKAWRTKYIRNFSFNKVYFCKMTVWLAKGKVGKTGRNGGRYTRYVSLTRL